eukprot:TRINITY_DN30914_c0_g1_i1.p1 TRINITY_DN30914_c0_g1~~TRINITY_DN30914_c0_g1_i1.p1  ORF type:complete len:873 (-),score=123.14 TRINITY_DN30914_c0_g1_i1:75-2693(-)
MPQPAVSAGEAYAPLSYRTTGSSAGTSNHTNHASDLLRASVANCLASFEEQLVCELEKVVRRLQVQVMEGSSLSGLPRDGQEDRALAPPWVEVCLPSTRYMSRGHDEGPLFTEKPLPQRPPVPGGGCTDSPRRLLHSSSKLVPTLSLSGGSSLVDAASKVGLRESASTLKFRCVGKAVMFSNRLSSVVSKSSSCANDLQGVRELASETSEPLRSPLSVDFSVGVSSRSASKRSTFATGGKLEVLPLWTRLIPQVSSRPEVTPQLSQTSRGSQELRSGGFVRDRSLLQMFILQPDNAFCILWDLLTTLVVFHDAVVLPLDLGFSPAWPSFMILAFSVISVIWMLDILLSFIRGTLDEQQGVVEMRPGMLARRYIKTWFFFDVSIVACDVFADVLEGSKLMRLVRLQRLLRLLRLIRLLRIVKIGGRLITNDLNDGSRSEKSGAALSIIKLLVILIVVNHFITCGWHGVGTVDMDEPRSRWVDVAFNKGEHDFAYRYLTSYHWSITQFTPASCEVQPTNYAERIYAVCVILCGLLMFSSFVSSMTQAMMQLKQLSSAERQQNQAVRRYISENHVSVELSSRVIAAVRAGKVQKPKKRLHEVDVSAFKNLPEALQVRLHEEVFTERVKVHAVFQHLKDCAVPVYRNVCHRAISEHSLAHAEELFHSGVFANYMYFVSHGSVLYFLGYDAEAMTSLKPGDWFSEACLWTRWEHRGRLSGEDVNSDLLKVEATQFHKIASSVAVARDLQKYANMFLVEAIKECGSFAELTDVWCTARKAQEMVRRATLGDQWRKKLAKKLLSFWDPTAVVQVAFTAWKGIFQSSHARQVGRHRSFWQFWNLGRSRHGPRNQRPGCSVEFGCAHSLDTVTEQQDYAES